LEICPDWNRYSDTIHVELTVSVCSHNQQSRCHRVSILYGVSTTHPYQLRRLPSWL